MAKELPYFRFTVQDWQNGKISLESYELKGLFIEVCGYYWINDCSLTLAMLQKKFRDAKEMLNELVDLNILKHENRHDKVEIEFLNIQYDLLSEKRKRRQDAGSKGGNAKAKLKQKTSYKDKDNNKDKDNKKDKYRDLVTLTLFEHDKLISDHGEQATNWMLDKLNAYKLSKGKTYKSDYGAILTWVVKSYEEHKKTLSKEETNPLINAINQMYKQE